MEKIPTSSEGHDAIGTHVVAASLNGHKSRRRTRCQAHGRDLCICLIARKHDIDLGFGAKTEAEKKVKLRGPAREKARLAHSSQGTNLGLAFTGIQKQPRQISIRVGPGNDIHQLLPFQ